MNIQFQQVEKKSQVFSYILMVGVAFAISMLILNAVRTNNLHLSIPSSVSGQAAYGGMNSLPVAIPAPQPPAEQINMAPTLVVSSTPSPLPKAVAVPVPTLP
jgi:hypothetical protein